MDCRFYHTAELWVVPLSLLSARRQLRFFVIFNLKQFLPLLFTLCFVVVVFFVIANNWLLFVVNVVFGFISKVSELLFGEAIQVELIRIFDKFGMARLCGQLIVGTLAIVKHMLKDL